MSEYVSNFVTLSEEELRPQQIHYATGNISLHVVAFDNLHKGHDADIFTLRDGQLPFSDRNTVVPPEDDARNIARIHGNLIVSADRSLVMPNNPYLHTQGFSVRLATSRTHPLAADLRGKDFSTSHNHKIERHKFSELTEHYQNNPEREIDAYYLNLFGRLALRLPQ